MKRAVSFSLALFLLLGTSLTFAACGDKPESLPNTVIIEVQDYGSIKVELYPNIAPITVANFKKLVAQGFYDGLTFHRVIPGFMIQGGDPLGNGTGGSEETITGEFSANGFNNKLSHTRGVISMARSGSPYETYLNYGYSLSDLPEEYQTSIQAAFNSASSQFFIVHKDSTYLDGNYAAFGMVIEGMDVVDKIAAVKTGSNDKPTEAVVITRITFYDPSESDPTGGEEKPSEGDPTGGEENPSESDPTGGEENPSEGDPTGGEENPSEGDPTGGEENPSEGDPTGGEENPSEGDPTGGEENPSESDPTGGEENPSEGDIAIGTDDNAESFGEYISFAS